VQHQSSHRTEPLRRYYVTTCSVSGAILQDGERPITVSGFASFWGLHPLWRGRPSLISRTRCERLSRMWDNLPGLPKYLHGSCHYPLPQSLPPGEGGPSETRWPRTMQRQVDSLNAGLQPFRSFPRKPQGSFDRGDVAFFLIRSLRGSAHYRGACKTFCKPAKGIGGQEKRTTAAVFPPAPPMQQRQIET